MAATGMVTVVLKGPASKEKIEATSAEVIDGVLRLRRGKAVVFLAPMENVHHVVCSGCGDLESSAGK